jgi:alpha-tubulin suppressor-like RCC1 family protein
MHSSFQCVFKVISSVLLAVFGGAGCSMDADLFERAAEGSSGGPKGGESQGGAGYGLPREPLLVKELAVGTAHTCALLADSTIACWGNGDRGQLGDGMSGKGYGQPVPTRIAGLSGATAIRAGRNTTCAIVGAESAVSCWGEGKLGQLGNGKSGDGYFEPLPVSAVGLAGVIDLHVAGSNACAVLGDGTVRCWGLNDPAEWLGFASPDCGPYLQEPGDDVPMSVMRPCESTPRTVPLLTGAARVTSGGSHNCALLSGGLVSCWGADIFGQLGNGMFEDHGSDPIPKPIAGLDGVIEVTAGAAHTCAVRADQTVQCWGDNSFGQLGIGIDALDSYKTVPTLVAGIAGVIHLDASLRSTCAVRSDQTVQCWGDTGELFEQPPDPTGGNTLKPTTVPEVTGAVDVRIFGFHACIRRSDATVACWGLNGSGELGAGWAGPADYSLKTVTF